jgi:hypothetical protein
LPLTAVRFFADPEKVALYDRVDMLGKATLERGPAIPGTEGRGICYVVTSGPLRVWRKKRKKRSPRRPRLSQ